MPEIIQDSITVISDSVVLLQQEVVKPEIRFDGELLQIIPQHSNWIPITLLILFSFFVISYARSHNWLSEFFKSFVKLKGKVNNPIKKTIETQQSQLLMFIFAIGTISLFSYLALFEGGSLKITTYLILLSVNFVFIITKLILSKIVAYTFSNRETYSLMFEKYLSTIYIISLIIYPLITIKTYLHLDSNLLPYNTLIFFVIILTLLSILLQIFQVFFNKILDFFHIMLYLCTLEILPFFGVFLINKWIIISL